MTSADGRPAGLAAAVGRFSSTDDAAERLLHQLEWLERKAGSAARRGVLAVALAWGVPLILSLVAGNALGPKATGPFLLDWGAGGGSSSPSASSS